MADHWYDALKRENDEIEVSGRGTVRALDRVAGADSPTYRAASDPRGRELERLTRMNERLLIVMEEVLRLQSTTLEHKLEGVSAQRELVIQGGEVDNEAIARVVRDTLDNQMKPVLTALLRLIEMNGGSVTPRSAMATIGQPVESLPTPAQATQRTASPGAPTPEALFVGSAAEALTTGPAPGTLAVGSAIRSAAPTGQPLVSQAAAAPARDAEKTTAVAAAPLAASAQQTRPEAIPLPSFLLTPKPVAATSGPSPAEMRAEAERERERARLATKLPLALGWLEVVS